MQEDSENLYIFFSVFTHEVVYSASSIHLAIKSIINNKS